jgi:hypothetical protein
MNHAHAGRTWLIAALAFATVVGLIAYVETHHWIPGFRAWTFGFVFLLGAILTGLARGRVRDGFLIGATFAFSLCFLEVGAIILEDKSTLEIPANWSVPRSVVGWAPGYTGTIHARRIAGRSGPVIYDAAYTVDKDGNRIVRGNDTGPAVVFFGDSFTFGDGVNDADTLPQRFANLFDGQRRVLNLGVSGYGPQQFLREVETGLKDEQIGAQPAAFVFLTSPFHAMRTACKESWTNRGPRYALEGDSLAFKGECYAGGTAMAREFLENTALYRKAIRPLLVYPTHADVDLYIRILAEAVRVSKAKYGVETIVPFVRAAPEYLAGSGYDNAAVIDALKARGVHVVDMTLADEPSKGLIYTIKGDGHPTGAANQVRAGRIAAILKDMEQTSGTSASR